MRIAIDQMAPILGDLKANLDHHRRAAEWAARQKAHLLVFPELSLTGYLLKGMVADVAMRPDDPRLEALAKKAKSVAILAGFVEKADDGQYFNSAAYIYNGAVRAVQRKIMLPTYGMFEERRFLASGNRIEPIDAPWGRMGVMICYDALQPGVAYLHQQTGARMLVTMSVSPARAIAADGTMGGRELFRLAHRAHSRLLGMITVFVNRVGSEEGLTFWGGSQILDPTGTSLGELPDYEPARTVCEVDLESVERVRTAFPQLKENRPDVILQELWRLRMGEVPVPNAPGERRS
jgi:predicted amidohydrolase